MRSKKSINIRKEDVGLKPPHYIRENGFGTSSIVSIADFIEFVNSSKQRKHGNCICRKQNVEVDIKKI